MKMARVGLIEESTRKLRPTAVFVPNMEYLEGIEVSRNPDEALDAYSLPSERKQTGMTLQYSKTKNNYGMLFRVHRWVIGSRLEC